MGVTIKPVKNGSGYWVNSIYVYKDNNELWVADGELTDYERQAFKEYRASKE